MPRHSALRRRVSARAVLSREALQVGGSHFAKAIGCDVRESLMDIQSGSDHASAARTSFERLSCRAKPRHL